MRRALIVTMGRDSGVGTAAHWGRSAGRPSSSCCVAARKSRERVISLVAHRRPSRSPAAWARGRSGVDSRTAGRAAWISYGCDRSRVSTAVRQMSVARNSHACHTALWRSTPTTGPVVSGVPGGSVTTGVNGATGAVAPAGVDDGQGALRRGDVRRVAAQRLHPPAAEERPTASSARSACAVCGGSPTGPRRSGSRVWPYPPSAWRWASNAVSAGSASPPGSGGWRNAAPAPARLAG